VVAEHIRTPILFLTFSNTVCRKKYYLLERLAANAEVAKVLDSITASSYTVEDDRQMILFLILSSYVPGVNSFVGETK
jgi:hypothetical protein